jgi:hypothetical protein
MAEGHDLREKMQRTENRNITGKEANDMAQVYK